MENVTLEGVQAGKDFYLINPPRKGRVPPHLRPYLFKKGHRAAKRNAGGRRKHGKKNPYEMIPHKAFTEKQWRDKKKGLFWYGGHNWPSKPRRNPADLISLGAMNPYRGRRRKARRNPPKLLGFVPSGLTQYLPAIKMAAGGFSGALVDRQLIPRAGTFLSKYWAGFTAWYGDLALRAINVLGGSMLVGKFGGREAGMGYAFGSVISALIKWIETGLTKAGVPMLSEYGYDVPRGGLSFFRSPSQELAADGDIGAGEDMAGGPDDLSADGDLSADDLVGDGMADGDMGDGS